MLDKLTYAGNRANLEGVEHEFHQGDIADPARGRDGRRGLRGDRQLRRRVARRPLDPRPGRVHPHRRPRHPGAARPCAPRRDPDGAGLDRRGLRRHRRRRASVHRGRPAPAVEPVLGVEDRRRPAGARLHPDLRRRRVHHARREQLRPAPVPGEADPALHHERLRGQGRCPSTATAASAASGCMPTTTPRRSSSCCARRPPGEIYNVGGQECENMDVVRRILDLTGASPDLVRHVDDRPGHDRRYAVDSSKVRDARLGARAQLQGRRPRGDGRLVPREPGLVGADQVRRVPRVLRAAVRQAPRRLSAAGGRPSGPNLVP